MLSSSIKRGNIRSCCSNIYVFILITTLCLLALDIMAWSIDGADFFGAAFLNRLVNALYFAVHCLPSFFWYLYVKSKILCDEKKVKIIAKRFIVPLAIYVLFALSNIFYDTIFTISENNIYSRKWGFIIVLFVSYSFLILASFQVFKNKRVVKQTDYYPMLLFALLPTICGGLQSVFYGFSLLWTGVSLSSFIVYVHVQNDDAITDSLTGLYNRRRLQEYLVDEINKLDTDDSLTGIMLDMDDFKAINDTYGHVMGDYALEDMACILKKSVRINDFIARYAGDEFVLVLKNKDEDYIKEILSELKKNAAIVNHINEKGYRISYSYGIYTFKGQYKEEIDDFISNMDKRMYENKLIKRSSENKLL